MASCFYRIYLVVLCALCAPLLIHAQTVPSSAEGIELTTSTNNPVPGQTITVTAQSYSIDISSASLVWSVNGKQIQKGVGMKTLSVVVPANGKNTTVDITGLTPEGRTVRTSLTLGSGSVDLILESDGYTPPFFRGSVPLVYQNRIKVIAVPHLYNYAGKAYAPETLVYQWRKDNGTAFADQSGYGKQSITLEGDIIPRSYFVSVDISTRDGSAQTQGTIQINPGTPSVQFYIDDALYGPLLNKAITENLRIGSQKETHVLAVPYGFNKPTNGIGNLTFDWAINGEVRTELASKQSLTLRAPEDSSGTSDIRLDLRNPDKILQGANGIFSVVFSSKASGVNTSSSAQF